MARILLNEGIDESPPVEELRESCREHRREYYDVRLQPWSDHTIALAHAFGRGDDWTPLRDIKQALIAADNLGDAVDPSTASNIIRELRDHGYIENSRGSCRPVLPSLGTYFEEMLSFG